MICKALICLLAIAPACLAAEKSITIKYYGHSFFQIISTEGTRIVIDPHAIREYGDPKVSADIAICTHLHDDHNRVEILDNYEEDYLKTKKMKIFYGVEVNEKAKRLQFKQVDEKVNGIRIRSVPSFHDTVQGKKRGPNAIFVIEVDGLKIVHLGDLGDTLTAEQIKAIGPVDILMVPVGGVFTINGSVAKEVVKSLNPRLYILPMHYQTAAYPDALIQPIDEFLEKQTDVRKLENDNELIVPVDLKQDKPRIIVLSWKKGS